MKETVYWEIFKDLYRLMADAYPPGRDDDAFIDELLGAAQSVADKYRGSHQQTFVSAMIKGIVYELSRIATTHDI